jgi:tripeptidyl-peptidase-1
MKLGLQGTTVVVSSGDSGVGDARGTNIANCLGTDGKIFVPDFRKS